MNRTPNSPALTAEQLFYGYTLGIFPMADERSGDIHWYSPEPRAVIPLETYEPPRSLRQVIKKNLFEIRVDTNFTGVMQGCAEARSYSSSTWISDELIAAYTELHRAGFAHSVEAYQDNALVGGLYGVSIGAAFFGESMFHRVSNASKVAFDFLIHRLREKEFELLDTQFINDNVLRFGAVEIPRLEYLRRLEKAIVKPVGFV